METTFASPAIRVSLSGKSNHPGNVAAYGKDQIDEAGDTMHQQFKQAIMQYHNEQLSLPKQINRIKDEMSITAKEQSIASDTQLKAHAHHYFLSPYRSNRCTGNGLVKVSHPEPLLSPNNITKLSHDVNDVYPEPSNKDTFLNTVKGRAKLASSDKLPPIFSIVTPRRIKQSKSVENKMWLGPPNSIPPNKRNEHIAAYKTIASTLNRQINSERISKSWTQFQKEHAKNNQGYLKNKDNDNTQTGIEQINDNNEDCESVMTTDNMSENMDTISHHSGHSFASFKLLDPHNNLYSSRSNNSSIHVRSMPDLERTHKREYTDSNLGNYSTKVVIPSSEQSYIDDLSSASSTVTRIKKSVHFAPDVRDNSRESRPLPVVSTKTYNSPVGLRLPLTYSGSTESVNQLPAVVEKYMIKNLPILPNISTNTMNVNAKVIYIKDGEMHSGQSSTNTESKSQIPQSYNQQQKTAASPPPQENTESTHKRKVELKVTLPSDSQGTYVKPYSTEATSTSPITPSLNQPSSNKIQSQNKKQPPPPKKASFTSKKIASKTKHNSNTAVSGSKKNKKPRNGSETSSRNSTNSVSPILDPDDPETRYKAYGQAMLAVQARMREFDIKFGSSQKIAIPAEQDEQLFGKVVLSSANNASKDSNKTTKSSKS